MNTIRMIAIALPTTLLLACGGGGSSGTATVAPPPMTMNPPDTNGDPNMPPMVMLEPLPAYTVTDITAAQNRFGGTAPTTSMTETQIVSAIQTRATVANSWLFTGARSTGISGLRATVTAPTCANNSCSLTLPNVGSLVFSLTDIEDLSLVDDTNLERFNSKTQSVMMDEGVTLIQSGTAARQSDGTQLAFQTYGGWLDNVVFGAERIEITENEIADVRLAGFSFGDATGTNPTGTSRAVWTGVFVGHDIERGIPIQGTAEVDIDDFDSPNVDLSIANVVDINSTASTAGSKFVNVTDMTLTDGTFTDVDGVVRGSFYGSGHTQVGGVVDNAGAWIGAFGGTRQ